MRTLALFVAVCWTAFARAEPKEGKAGVDASTMGMELPEFPGKLYGKAELRHHLNSYYTTDGSRSRQTPTFHARAKVGATFRDYLIDAYATFGVIKTSNTQQVLQRRPELEVDLYPWLSRYGQLVQYNLIQLPFRETAIERQESEGSTPRSAGTIYTFGLAPTLVLPIDWSGHLLKLKGGVDGWTQFFSQRQFQDDNRPPDERDQFAAALTEGDADDADDADDQEFQEDTAQRYYTQYMIGSNFTPRFAPHIEASAGVYYDVRFVPQYEVVQEETGYKYVRQNTSHYRLRLSISLTKRATLINDFYHFHDGFFESRRTQEDRRFRNIARLTYQL